MQFPLPGVFASMTPVTSPLPSKVKLPTKRASVALPEGQLLPLFPQSAYVVISTAYCPIRMPACVLGKVPIVSESVALATCAGDDESVTVTPKVKVPVAAGLSL